MTLLEQLMRLRDNTDPRESVWVERRGSRIALVHEGRGLELCGDDSDDVLHAILIDLLGASEFAFSDFT